MSDSVRPHRRQPTRLLCAWDSLGKITGVGCQALSGDLPHPGIKPASLLSPALAGKLFTISVTWEAHFSPVIFLKYTFRMPISFVLILPSSSSAFTLSNHIHFTSTSNVTFSEKLPVKILHKI